MKLLGRVEIIPGLQRALVQGAVIEIDRATFRRFTKATARIGDLLWVQEPFWLLQNTQGLERKPAIIPAPNGPITNPPRYISLHTCTKERKSAKYLPRQHSRATLEIMGVMPDSAGLRCLVHMQQVDEFLKSRVAA